jgi:hypothetical protein
VDGRICSGCFCGGVSLGTSFSGLKTEPVVFRLVLDLLEAVLLAFEPDGGDFRKTLWWFLDPCFSMRFWLASESDRSGSPECRRFCKRPVLADEVVVERDDDAKKLDRTSTSVAVLFTSVISVFSALLEVCLVSEEPVCFSLKDVAIFGVLVLELELLLLYTKVVEFRGDVDRGEGHRDGNSCGVLQPTGDEDVGDPRIHSTDSSTLTEGQVFCISGNPFFRIHFTSMVKNSSESNLQ